ncbi:MAG: O-antigen ligase family protein [bacterium]
MPDPATPGERSSPPLVTPERSRGGSRAVERLARALPDAFLAGVSRWAIRALAASVAISIAATNVAFGVALVAWALRLALHGGPRWPATPADKPFAVFLACCLLSALVGIDTSTALWSLRAYAQILVLYLVVAHAHEEDERRRLAWILTVGFFISGWHQVYNYRWQNFHKDWGPGKMTRASQLVIAVAVTHALWLASRGWRRRAGVGALLAMQIAGLVCTFKRGAWVGSLVGLSTQLWRRNRKLVLVPLVIAAAVVVTFPAVRVRLSQSGDDFVHTDNRLHMWKIAVQLIRDYPLGIGTHNGGIMKRTDLWGTEPPKHRHFHSNLITIWVEDGVLGLAAFVAWLLALARLLVARVRSTAAHPGSDAALAIGAATAFLAWNVNGLVEFNFGDAEVMMLLYFVLGLALAPALASAPGARTETPAGVEVRP